MVFRCTTVSSSSSISQSLADDCRLLIPRFHVSRCHRITRGHERAKRISWRPQSAAEENFSLSLPGAVLLRPLASCGDVPGKIQLTRRRRSSFTHTTGSSYLFAWRPQPPTNYPTRDRALYVLARYAAARKTNLSLYLLKRENTTD